MNTKHLIILVLIGLCVVSCWNHPTQVKVNNQEVAMAPFENIDAGGEFTIIYTQGDVIVCASKAMKNRSKL